MGPVVRLWDFKRGVVPSPSSVNEALAHVDYRNVLVDGRSVCLLDPDSAIVLGGIAKGFIADALLDLLRSRGVSSAIVNLGGNVAVMGGKPDGSPFSVGLRAPISSAQRGESCFAALPLHDGSVVTSGVYERAFEQGGEFFHHILDPRTGFPARSDIVSASVIARNSLDADGFSTALVIMGLDCAKDFIEARDGVEAVFMTAGGEVYATSGAAQFR
jgi:thiamine biosynthesis lipoprotein